MLTGAAGQEHEREHRQARRPQMRPAQIRRAAAAYRDSFLVTAVIFAAALLPTWLLHRAQRTALRRSAAAATAMESEADIEAGFALEPFGPQRDPA